MIGLPPGLIVSADSVVQFADWIEINALLEGTAGGTVSAKEAGDLLIANPPIATKIDINLHSYKNAALELVEGAFGHLQERSGYLQHHYPLLCNRGTVKPIVGCERYEIYRFLVSLRARQMYPNALRDDGIEAGLLFEDLATQAFGKYIGARPEHRIRFGVAGGLRGSGLPLNLGDALEDLSQRMNEKRGKESFKGTGDIGVDCIAWRAFGDKRAGQLVLMGQATISEKSWLQKQPPTRWTRQLNKSGPPIAFLARPVTAVAFAETLPPDAPPGLKALGEEWVSIPFDRLRILSLLRDKDIPEQLREQMNEWVNDFRGRFSQ